MAGSIAEIIATVNPDKYYAYKTKKELAEFKKLIKADFSEALNKAKPKAAEEHTLIYDSTSETLEPVYFWILDFMKDNFRKVEKLVDNFTSSPGSGHFGELGQRATVMQQQGMNMLAQVNTVLKSVMNLIYDLKEFQIRLENYNASNSKDKERAEAGVLALKQIWMDNVDIKRGRGSINMLAQDLNFVTLRDAFMVAKSVEEVDKMDLNERVKRILKPRMHEFLQWKKRSETELRKRYEIEKQYLKSQVNSLKLYTRWAKPYLIAAEKLRMHEMGREPSLVNVFNTMVLQLTILGRSEINVEEEAVDKNLPEEFRKLKVKRPYYFCVLVEFIFRGIPQRISPQQSHYAFGGRTEVNFRGYCLNEEEINLLDERLGESDIADALKLIEGTTDESLKQLQEDLDEFLKGEQEKEAEKEELSEEQDVNPFSALFGAGKKKKEEKKEKGEEKRKKSIERLKEQGVGKDNYAESVIRTLGEQNAQASCFKVFDVYKKAHGMESHPEPNWEERWY